MPTFFAVATKNTRVRAVFSEAMLQNVDLTNPAKYTLISLDGTPVTINSVETEQSSHIRSTVLLLDSGLVDERHYRLTVSSSIVTESGGLPVSPDTSVFQWVENALRVSIPLDRFSGEVQNGLYGIHGGLVFFSPALVTAAADSVIQVDNVSVCTKAFDEYHFPQPIDPPVFFTHGSSVTPTPQVTTLNSTAALWAKFPRICDARFELENHLSDTVPTPVSGPCTATFTEPWDLAFISLLNNTSWKLFDNAGTPPAYFITANNLGPIPPGPTVTVILE